MSRDRQTDQLLKDPLFSAQRRAKEILCLVLVISISWTVTVYSRTLPKIPVYLKGKEVWVEVAENDEDRGRGLMGRKSLGRNEGMLFIFESEGYHGFWMKNTLLPLSIAFIDREGTIVEITDMEPLTLTTHDPPKPILYALEMNKGWFGANGIKAGDRVRFSK